jgi:septal ring factor EnvC (AmiA/AmiB activator)
MPIMRNYRVSRGGSQAKWLSLGIFLISLAAIFFVLFAYSHTVRADDCEDIQDDDDQITCYSDEIAKATKKRSEWSSKLEQYKKDQSATAGELNQIQLEIDSVRASLVNINKNLEVRRASLSEKLQLRDSIVRAQYQEGRLTDLEFFLYLATNMNGFKYSTLVYIFDKSLADEAFKIFYGLNTEISNF